MSKAAKQNLKPLILLGVRWYTPYFYNKKENNTFWWGLKIHVRKPEGHDMKGITIYYSILLFRFALRDTHMYVKKLVRQKSQTHS